MKAYRICEIKNNKLYTLFHGINGSRQMPMHVWLNAEIKDVCDGNHRSSTKYKSGFHVLVSADSARDIIKKQFRAHRDLAIVECEIDGNIWKKSHSKSVVFLSEKIQIKSIIDIISL